MTKFLRIFILNLFCLHIAINTAYPIGNKSAQKTNDEYSAENTIGFIKHLISSNEYYRGSVELSRLSTFYPGYIKKENIFTTELFLLFKGRQYSKILSNDYNIPKIKYVDLVFKADTLLERNNFLKCNNLLLASSPAAPAQDISYYLNKRTMFSFFMLNRIDEAEAIYNKNNFNDIFGFSVAEFDKMKTSVVDSFASLKKPYNALLFGAVPGMGYVYADQAATGILAFVLISALSTLTYYSFKTDNKPVGIFVGCATAFFYGGSIIGGYLSTKKYNDSVINNLKDSMTLQMRLAEDREEIYNRYGIGNIGK